MREEGVVPGYSLSCSKLVGRLLFLSCGGLVAPVSSRFPKLISMISVEPLDSFFSSVFRWAVFVLRVNNARLNLSIADRFGLYFSSGGRWLMYITLWSVLRIGWIGSLICLTLRGDIVTVVAPVLPTTAHTYWIYEGEDRQLYIIGCNRLRLSSSRQGYLSTRLDYWECCGSHTWPALSSTALTLSLPDWAAQASLEGYCWLVSLADIVIWRRLTCWVEPGVTWAFTTHCKIALDQIMWTTYTQKHMHIHGLISLTL